MADIEVPVDVAVNNAGEKVESVSTTDDQDVQEQKPDLSVNAATEPSLLEDETMPSYMSVTTSTVSSAKPDDLKTTQVDDDLATDIASNGDDKSVYEVSSDDENDRQYYRNNREDDNDDLRMNEAKRARYYQDNRRRYHSDSEEDDDEDDDEDDEEDDDEDEDDEDEEDDDEELEKYKRYDRSEDEYEADKFERSSDDFVIRPSAGLDKNCKKRSASMEELSPRKRTEKNNKRQALPTHFEELSGHPEISLICNSRRNSVGRRSYNHVTSKVKQYIQDGQEQRRLSAQRRSIEKVNVDCKRVENDKDIDEGTDNLRLNPQCRLLKNYSEFALKNAVVEDPLSIVEVDVKNLVTENGNNIAVDVKNNGQDKEDAKMEIEVEDDDDDDGDDDEENAKNVNSNKLVDKVNGVIDHSSGNEKEDAKIYQEDEEEIDQPENLIEKNPVAILSVQTLTSEEFARNDYENNESEMISLNENHVEKEESEVTVNVTVNVKPVNVLPIISQVTEEQEIDEVMAEELSAKQEYENTVRELMYQLQQKNSDCAKMGQEYQRVVRETAELTKEANSLRKALEYQQEIQQQQLRSLQQQQQQMQEQQQKIQEQQLKIQEQQLKIQGQQQQIQGQQEQIQAQQQQIQEQRQQIQEQRQLLDQQKAKEVKTVAIQTEDQPKKMIHSSTRVNLIPPSNNASTATAGSTMSSIDQWTDSEYSPVVSLKPPNIDHLLNSDVSMINSEIDTTLQNKPTSTTTAATPAATATPPATSRAMLTTTRIIQTLARMTPGKPNPNASEDQDAPVKSSGASHESAGKQSGLDATGQEKSTQQLIDGETEDDDVKCIIWHEDEVTKQRSCLIQTAVPPEESAKMKGKLRHCGPYLLGNVEVRISEANGTLNIYGKEVSPFSSAEELDEETEGINSCEHAWSKMSDKNGVNFFSPSIKKSKTPSSMRAGISKLRSMLTRTPSPVNDNEESPCCSSNQRGLKYKKRSHSSSCNNHSSHSLDKTYCCLHKGEINIGDSGFNKDDDMMEDNMHSLFDLTRKIIGRESSRPSSPHGHIDSRTFTKSNPRIDDPCRHSSRRCSYSETDDTYQRDCKSCHHSPAACHNQDNSFYQDFKSPRNVNPFCTNFPKSETFIHPGKLETPEVKKLRDKGKTVRTIMEFLKSCGNSHTTSFESSFIPETVTTAQSHPSMRFNSIPSSTSCQKQANSSCQKCCPSCEKRIGIASEMESELEKIRSEITKLYSKSDAMREMLNILRSVEN
ncbi:uncharacterized protein LOC130672644 isoform X2 [Microplitis mediator]|uniref:uncharacterized protein LOC130672644 isoform X2 n=1 Tax=Microplitis mediator TaxID=375433 RepID=UPI002554605D|nr:uncharacterized protein LOC130672644 isoform X2 [Microplitis mediator]